MQSTYSDFYYLPQYLGIREVNEMIFNLTNTTIVTENLVSYSNKLILLKFWLNFFYTY